MPEPRDPLLKVLMIISSLRRLDSTVVPGVFGGHEPGALGAPGSEQARRPAEATGIDRHGWAGCGAERTPEGAAGNHRHGNDPSAGSPTETLLRLLLPLNDQV